MKSRFEKNEDYDPYDESEVNAGDPEVATVKGNKMLIIFASAILITVVLYFFFFKGQDITPLETLEEVTSQQPSGQAPAPAPANDTDIFTDDFLEEEEDILQKPQTPDLPDLPDLPLDNQDQPYSGLLSGLIGNIESKTDTSSELGKTISPSALELPTISVPIPYQQPTQQNKQTQQGQQIQQGQQEINIDPKKAPIILMSSGGPAPELNVGYNNIIILDENLKERLMETKSTIIPTIIADRTLSITQGKMLTAILETAINTEIPGSVRAVVSRDVYAESGTNILIPKGSRLYGSYSSAVLRGQARVEIVWQRLIRPDGVDLNISFVAADQFGRAGLEGDVDNKYGAIITNSLLTSLLTVGAAVLTEKAANLGSTTSTTTSDGSVTTSGSAASKVLADVGGSTIDVVTSILTDSLGTKPVIRVPQGTRITIIVNADMTLPPWN